MTSKPPRHHVFEMTRTFLTGCSRLSPVSSTSPRLRLRGHRLADDRIDGCPMAASSCRLMSVSLYHRSPAPRRISSRSSSGLTRFLSAPISAMEITAAISALPHQVRHHRLIILPTRACSCRWRSSTRVDLGFLSDPRLLQPFASHRIWARLFEKLQFIRCWWSPLNFPVGSFYPGHAAAVLRT